MKRIAFHFRQGWQTLRARPGLSILAVILLAFTLWLCAGLLGTLLLLHDIRRDLMRNLATYIELHTDITDMQKTRITSLVKRWPDVAEVSYISPDSALRLHSAEVGEDLQNIFGGNPFPAVICVRFDGISNDRVDSLAVQAARWEGVADVVYPREIWQRLEELTGRIQGRIGITALVLLLISLLMVTLVLRAQFTGRRKEWRLLLLLGMGHGGLQIIAQVQAALVGISAGILAAVGVKVLVFVYYLALLERMYLPVWFYAVIVLAGIAFTIPIGLFASHKVKLLEK